jgi:hypothetical protein
MRAKVFAFGKKKPKFCFGKNIKKWMQTSHFSNFTLLINSPNQNEIVGRFPVRVQSLAVRLFPVWTPSQFETGYVFPLYGVNGSVAVH